MVCRVCGVDKPPEGYRVISVRIQGRCRACENVTKRIRHTEAREHERAMEGDLTLSRFVRPAADPRDWVPPTHCLRCRARVFFRPGQYPSCPICGWEDLSMPTTKIIGSVGSAFGADAAMLGREYRSKRSPDA